MSTHEFLPTLGVNPLLGRAFSEADDRPSSPATVILSYGYWQRRFGGAEDVLGQTLTVDGAPHEVDRRAAAGLPLSAATRGHRDTCATESSTRVFPSDRGTRYRAAQEGVTLAQASADVARMIRFSIDTFPIVPGLTREAVQNMQLGPNLRSLKKDIVGDLDDVLWVLMGTMGVLLLGGLCQRRESSVGAH